MYARKKWATSMLHMAMNVIFKTEAFCSPSQLRSR